MPRTDILVNDLYIIWLDRNYIALETMKASFSERVKIKAMFCSILTAFMVAHPHLNINDYIDMIRTGEFDMSTEDNQDDK